MRSLGERLGSDCLFCLPSCFYWYSCTSDSTVELTVQVTADLCIDETTCESIAIPGAMVTATSSPSGDFRETDTTSIEGLANFSYEPGDVESFGVTAVGGLLPADHEAAMVVEPQENDFQTVLFVGALHIGSADITWQLTD
ncbi:hypothetical protein [Phytoactinopolyspora endophytica]|uniref:hypothetical protein n=1 Tax=Phytoactinopolyspora endophytica TaxID=1642495 RepID=UPI00101CED7F|nr:hypothetical protein [Phytoactinopolyspora endophytica]